MPKKRAPSNWRRLWELERKVTMIQTRRATTKRQGKDKGTLSMPQETFERFAEGPMPREDLTRPVATIVDEVLQ